ncbi:nuclear transport factor 2 family protein [Synechococcus sp. ATX 2A4]|nr:nuclear transport factor 2 family protein [Synechococcus sp. ATX 2A4]
MSEPMSEPAAPLLTPASLQALFTKPYGQPAPSQEQWRAVYAENVHFSDPTQEASGIDAYLAAQEGLMKRCDDVMLRSEAVAISDRTAFVEWVMGLRIKGVEFVYPGTTRLLLDEAGKIIDHRDYFDFVGPTFAPVPVIGPFVRWMYRRFVS